MASDWEAQKPADIYVVIGFDSEGKHIASNPIILSSENIKSRSIEIDSTPSKFGLLLHEMNQNETPYIYFICDESVSRDNPCFIDIVSTFHSHLKLLDGKEKFCIYNFTLDYFK